MFSIDDLTECHAKQICDWRYLNEYEVYNCPSWDTIVSHAWGLADESKRKNEFKSIKLHNIFIGFFRLHFYESKLHLSLGLMPEYCGSGHGSELIKLIIIYAKENYPQNDIHLAVRDFNIRAIKAYKKAGFFIEDSYMKNEINFISMKYIVS